MTNSSPDISQKIVRLSWSIFGRRLAEASLTILCLGCVAILLWHFNGSVDLIFPDGADPFAFLGGAIALVALTLMGVPVMAATATGIAIWLAIQNFL